MKKKVSSDRKEQARNFIRRSLYKVVFFLILIVLGLMYYEKRVENERREEGLFPITAKKSPDTADKTTFVYVNNSNQDVLFETVYGNMSVPAGETRQAALHQVKGDFEIVAREVKTDKELNKLIYRFKQLGEVKLIIKKLKFEINSLNEIGMMDAEFGTP